MKIRIICVGTMREAPLRELLDRYTQRIPYYMPFEMVTIPDIRAARNLTPDRQKELEATEILRQLAPGDYNILLDERGKELTSRELAQFIERKTSILSRNLNFIIGGPYGFAKPVYDRADMMLGLSRMTFTHEMARVLTAEQIYRAQTILRGEPYHHD
ncbi:MAG: 23S rRNA (pseudouridine(1915)-N(3))-methyltransferase RlmH [Muribaculaceae bacterium]